MSNFVATNVYALFRSPAEKSRADYTMCKKTSVLVEDGFPKQGGRDGFG